LAASLCLAPGNKRVPIRIMYRTPATVTGSPTQKGKKRLSGFTPCSLPESMASIVRPEMIRFTDVPISVMVPPRIEAKLTPMKSFDGASPVVRDRSRIAGIIMATVQASAACRLAEGLQQQRRADRSGAVSRGRRHVFHRRHFSGDEAGVWTTQDPWCRRD